MHKYFIGSYFLTIFGIIAAYLWGEHVHSGTGLVCVFIALILAVLETSLSFDNAVVNAMKLEHMSEVWRHRFLTWGIAIAVFGMRFLFPILVVSIFAHLDMVTVTNIALTDSQKYASYLHATHAPIVTFGGLFLIMLFLNYFFTCFLILDQPNYRMPCFTFIVSTNYSYLESISGKHSIIRFPER